MGCLTVKEAIIDADRSTADSAKEAADDQFDSLKALVPNPGELRKDFEIRKGAGISSAKSSVDSLISSLHLVNIANSALSKFKGSTFDIMSSLQGGSIEAIIAVFGGISAEGLGMPSLAPITAALDIAKLAEQNMQCS